MAATPEAKVKASIKKILQRYGVYYAMPIGSGYGNSGTPDFLCCVPGGIFLAIEAKAGKGRTTALQDKHLEAIKLCGGYAMVVNETGLLELDEMLARMTDGEGTC
jgi:hypothetical protein